MSEQKHLHGVLESAGSSAEDCSWVAGLLGSHVRRPSSLRFIVLLAVVGIGILCFRPSLHFRHVDNVEIRGSVSFIKQTAEALARTKLKCPSAYSVVTGYVGVIIQGKHSGMHAYTRPPVLELSDRTAFYSITWCAASIAHDAFHSKLYWDYLNQHPDVLHVPDVIWSGEAAERLCSEYEQRVMKEIGAPSLEISSTELTNHYWEIDYNERDW